MTRKDFIKIAATIAAMPIDSATRAIIVDAMAVTLASTNERFDRARFTQACHPVSEEGE